MSTALSSGNYQIVLSTKLNIDTVKQQIKELNKNPLELKINVKISDSAIQKVRELNDLLKKTDALNQYTQGLTNIQKTMQSYEKVASKVVTATNNMASSVQSVSKSTANASQAIKSFGDKVTDAFQKFSLWSVVSGMFYQVVRSMEGLIDTAVQLDTAFTELMKVTDLTRGDFDRLTTQAYELGAEVAKTTTEVVNAMTEFARAGYSVEESSDILAKNALMWTNISDGTVDAAEAANMLISVMKAFNVEAQNTTHVIDALNEVSNNFAISSGQLSNSLTKSSSVLANAGVTFEQQLGLITAGTEVIRNANLVSTGLRTISLRLQGMEEDGTKVEGLTAKLEDDFNKLGLTLYDTNGKIKDTYAILADLAEIYPKLTAEQKAYYTELIAGKTRAQVAAAVLSNFTTAIDATATAYNSAGSAAEENAKVLDSLHGHLQKLQSEWESLVNSKATQDTLKFFIDLATSVVQLIKALGGIPAVVTTAVAAFLLVKKEKLIELWTGLGNAIVKLGYNLQIADFRGFTKVLTSSQIAMLKYGSAIALVMAAVIALKAEIDYLSEAYERNAKAARDALDSYEAAKNDTQQIESQLKNIEDQIKELNENPLNIIGEQELKNLETARKELELQLAVKQELERIAKSEAARQSMNAIKGIGSMTRSELEAAGVDTSNDSRDKIAHSQVKGISTGLNMLSPGMGSAVGSLLNIGMAVGEATQGWDTYLSETQRLFDANEKINKQIAEQEKLIRDLEAAHANGSITEKEYTQTKASAEKKLKEYKDTLNTNTTAIGEHVEKLTTYKEVLDETDEEQSKTIAIIEWFQNSLLGLNKTYSSFNEIWKEVTGDQKEALQELLKSGNLTIGTLQEKFPKLAAIIKKYSQYSGESIEDLIIQIESLLDTDDEITEVTSKLYSELSTVTAKYTAGASAIAEYNKYGALSISTLNTMLDKYPDLLQLFNKEGYSLDVLNKKLKENIHNENVLELAKKAHISVTKDNIGIIYEEAKATLEDAKAQYKLAMAMDANARLEIFKNITELEFAISTYEQIEESIKKGFDTPTGGKTTSTADAWKEAFTKAYNELKNRRDKDLIDTKTYFDELKKLNDKYFKDRVEYAEEYAKYELEIYKGMQTIFKEQLDSMKHAITMLENQGADREVIIAKYKELQETLHEQAEYYRSLNLAGNQAAIDELSEQWWQYQKTIEKIQKEILDEQKELLEERFKSLRDYAIDAIEEQIKAQEDWLDAANEKIDAQIDKLKEENTKLDDQKEIEEKLLKIEEARKKLADAKNQKVRIYREGRGFVYETDFDVVAKAQQELDELLADWNLFQEKARINDIISQLEAEKEANKKRVNEEVAKLNELKEAWDKSLDIAQDVEDYQGWLTRIQESENSSFDQRLQSVKDFVSAYNAETALLQTKYAEPGMSQTTTAVAAGVSNGGITTKTYNGVSYNPNVDYQKLINEAVASGAPSDELARLEQKRNAKIAGEGITDYSPTYNYSGSSKSSSKSSGSSSKSSGSSAHNETSSSSSSGSNLLSAVGKAVVTLAKVATGGLAGGTDNADGLMHFVGENGPELYIPPKGSGVIPNPQTTNLMAWGEINPAQLIARFAGGAGTVIDINNVTLPNVTDAESFVEELKNFKGFAIQKQSVRQ